MLRLTRGCRAMVSGRLFLLLSVLAVGLSVNAVEGGRTCPMVHIVPEQLPDLTIPRSGHNIFYVNGELTVVGGHTTHFVPTATAEYFADDAWHPMTMAYPHDDAFAVTLRSGEVVIGGGHSEELGVGQTYTLEKYYSPHVFEGFGCLDRRRVLANAVQLSDGHVIISGNHYAADAIACYDGGEQVLHVKDVAQGRSNPYILPIASDDAIILSGTDQYDRHPDTLWVDRLKGDAFRAPLLEQWRPVYTDQPFSSEACRIDDEQQGDYSYLLTVTNDSGQLAFVVARDTVFSLLSTATPVPMRSQYGSIFYKGPAVVDREHRRGYVVGVDSLCRRQYVLSVDLAVRPAQLTLYYTDTLEHSTVTIPVVTPEGNLILAGGEPEDNYKPLSTVWLYRFATSRQASADAALPIGILVFVAIAIVALAFMVYLYRRRRLSSRLSGIPASDLPAASASDLPDASASKRSDSQLMQRICQLMDDEQLFLHSDLKVQDVAVRLNISSSYVSECINNHYGQSFSQFVNSYRVRYAQNLLQQDSETKLVVLAKMSGFNSEVSFFRNFKTFTGMTPREWLQKGETTNKIENC